MLSRTVSVSQNTPGRRPLPRFRLVPKIKRGDVSKETKATLAILLRPSTLPWKLILRRSRSAGHSPSPSTETLVASSSSETLTLDEDTPPPVYTGPKRVRFHDQPLVFSRKMLAKRPKSGSQSPQRPCLVVRRYGDPYATSSESSRDTDSQSIYEDCLSNYPGFRLDIQTLEDRKSFEAQLIEESRTSDFFETEYGYTRFDRTGYRHYCLSICFDKQREASRAPKKLVFEHPAHLPWPSRAPPSPTFELPEWAQPLPPLPASVPPPPRPLLKRLQKCIVDEVENAIVVLIIGLFIHACIFLYFLYDVFTRGLVPSDD
ncbi:hypothetical protein PAXINDRAFT_103139 [Paxillus involutus ATCC 200175]|uniref:Uncharacterized protein n=1 Tax=Paxillus involutus ATCC 200175 TaxID=664439 RepID=A0A0C9SMZ4_PAXIN|nr:hypothetical protein PAXINDRAFT_103139 [Paxillus involutus ATCC 200175]